MDRASEIEERPALLSPKSDHRDYNRYKYYSALRTGYKHLAPEVRESFLKPPTHVVDANLFLLQHPFQEVGKPSTMAITLQALAMARHLRL
jgi:hypothetical protein